MGFNSGFKGLIVLWNNTRRTTSFANRISKLKPFEESKVRHSGAPRRRKHASGKIVRIRYANFHRATDHGKGLSVLRRQGVRWSEVMVHFVLVFVSGARWKFFPLNWPYCIVRKWEVFFWELPSREWPCCLKQTALDILVTSSQRIAVLASSWVSNRLQIAKSEVINAAFRCVRM